METHYKIKSGFSVNFDKSEILVMFLQRDV